MKTLSYILLITTLLLSVGCNRHDKTKVSTYYYPANRFYTGSHPSTYYISANLTATGKGNALQLKVSLNGIYSSSDSFSVHIHKKDITQPFGYSGNPVIDFGYFRQGNYTRSIDITSFDYDYFINNFQGFLVVHDPTNIQNDTTTLLIYGKTGKVN